MSLSPQPPSALTHSPDVHTHATASPNITMTPNDPPSQLASLLSNSLREVEALRRDLAHYKRRAEKAERLLASFQKLSAAVGGSQNSSATTPSSSQPPHVVEESVRLVLLEYEARVERAEIDRDELSARIHRMQEAWGDLERHLIGLESRSADARVSFGRLMAARGGELVVVGEGPPVATALAVMQQQIAARDRSSQGSSLPSHPFPSFPPPPAPNSRVRPRPDSPDLIPYSTNSLGSGGQPPSKRLRSDPSDRGRDLLARSRARHNSQSPAASPLTAHLSAHQVDQSPPRPHPLQTNLSSVPYHTVYGHQHVAHPRSRDSDKDAEDPMQIHYVDLRKSKTRPTESRPRGRRRQRSRTHSKSRSRSRASSASLDEMLLEATTGDDPDRRGLGDAEPIGIQHSRSQTQGVTPITHHSSQHLAQDPHGSSRIRHRSPSLERDRSNHANGPHLHQSHHPARSRAPSSLSLGQQSLHPSASVTGPGVPGGPISFSQPSQVQNFQTHVFTPPVTGAPVKKSKLANTPNSASPGGQGSNGSVVNMGASGGVISGPLNTTTGSYPPTNASGQRICRQCGQPGRYKEGKCVEKWGPGPEGPGTVCDRCRKKMKRVERRGTLDSQQLGGHPPPHLQGSQQHFSPVAAVHPSAAVNAAAAMSNGRSAPQLATSQQSQNLDRSIQRSDTMLVDSIHPIIGKSTLGPSGTHLLSNNTFRHDRDRGEAQQESPHLAGSSSRSVVQRSPPTPPHIATLPGSSVPDIDYERSGHKKGSRAQSREAPPQRATQPSNGHRSHHSSSSSTPPTRVAPNGLPSSRRESPRESDASRGSGVRPKTVVAEVDGDADADADADADIDAEADFDADADGDAEAELLEAVDAAEANNAATVESPFSMKQEDP